jgi:L-rhamnose mutarotase
MLLPYAESMMILHTEYQGAQTDRWREGCFAYTNAPCQEYGRHNDEDLQTFYGGVEICSNERITASTVESKWFESRHQIGLR